MEENIEEEPTFTEDNDLNKEIETGEEKNTRAPNEEREIENNTHTLNTVIETTVNTDQHMSIENKVTEETIESNVLRIEEEKASTVKDHTSKKEIEQKQSNLNSKELEGVQEENKHEIMGTAIKEVKEHSSLSSKERENKTDRIDEESKMEENIEEEPTFTEDNDLNKEIETGEEKNTRAPNEEREIENNTHTLNTVIETTVNTDQHMSIENKVTEETIESNVLRIEEEKASTVKDHTSKKEIEQKQSNLNSKELEGVQEENKHEIMGTAIKEVKEHSSLSSKGRENKTGCIDDDSGSDDRQTINQLEEKRTAPKSTEADVSAGEMHEEKREETNKVFSADAKEQGRVETEIVLEKMERNKEESKHEMRGKKKNLDTDDAVEEKTPTTIVAVEECFELLQPKQQDSNSNDPLSKEKEQQSHCNPNTEGNNAVDDTYTNKENITVNEDINHATVKIVPENSSLSTEEKGAIGDDNSMKQINRNVSDIGLQHQQVHDGNEAKVENNSLVTVDGAMMVEMEDLSLSQQQQNYLKETNDYSKTESNESMLEEQNYLQKEEDGGSNVIDDESSSSSSSTYSSGTESDVDDDEQASLSLMQRRARNMERLRSYRKSLFFNKDTRNSVVDNGKEQQQLEQSKIKNFIVAIDANGSSIGREKTGDDKGNFLSRARKRRRGMLFGTSYNNIPSSVAIPCTNSSLASTALTKTSTNTAPTTTTLIEELNLRYPYRSPQIRILHSILTSTIRQTSNSTPGPSSTVYVPPSIFVTGPSGTGKSSIVSDLTSKLASTSHNDYSKRRERGVGYAYVNCATLEPSSISILLDSAYQQIMTSGFTYNEGGRACTAGADCTVGSDVKLSHKKRKRKSNFIAKEEKEVSFYKSLSNDGRSSNEKRLRGEIMEEVISKSEDNCGGKSESIADTPMSSIILEKSGATVDQRPSGDLVPQKGSRISDEGEDGCDNKNENLDHGFEEDEDDVGDNHYHEDMEDTIERERKHGKRSSIMTRSTSVRKGTSAKMTVGGGESTGGTTREKSTSFTKNSQNNQSLAGNLGRIAMTGGSGGGGTGSHGCGLIVRFGRSLVPFCGTETDADVDDRSFNNENDQAKKRSSYCRQSKGCAFLVLDHANRLLSLTSKQQHQQQISTNERNNFLVQLLLLPKVMKLNLTIIVITNNVLLEYSRFNNILAPQAALGTIRDSIQPITVHFHAYRGQKIFKKILKQPRLRQLVIGVTDFEMKEKRGTLSCAVLRRQRQRLIDLLYDSMVATLIQSLESSTRDLRDFLQLCRILWPQYIHPLLHEDSPDVGSYINRLICSFPSDDDVLCQNESCLYCAFYNPSICQEMQKTRAAVLEMLNKKVREFIRLILVHNLFMPGRGPPTQEEPTGQRRFKFGSVKDLSFQSKFLLMSGYLCQNNKADRDAGLFTSRYSSGRTKKSVLSSSADNLAYASKNAIQHIRASRLSSFPLERMFSIFSSIVKQYGSDSCHSKNKCNEHGSVDVGGMGSCHLFLSLAHLRDLGLLREVSVSSASGDIKGSSWEHVKMEHTKYSCTLSRDEAMELAECLNFPISNYLRD